MLITTTSLPVEFLPTHGVQFMHPIRFDSFSIFVDSFFHPAHSQLNDPWKGLCPLDFLHKKSTRKG